jgi:adenylosuccinate lyase
MSTPSPYDTYSSPLASRNASAEMLRLWSPRHKFNTWRRIWLAVAEAQHELTSSEGAPGATSGPTGWSGPPLVTREQVVELRAVVERGITDDEIRAAEKYERELRHDVMAHVHALGNSCPKAKGIIHLGMTSQDVVCNADLLILRDATELIRTKLARCALALGDRARVAAGISTLGFTHYQPAQPVTVGRRMSGWAYDLTLVIERVNPAIPLRGLRGATGTQASFSELLRGRPEVGVDVFEAPDLSTDPNEGDWRALRGVDALEHRFLSWANFGSYQVGAFTLTGQTYPRVIDTFILADLASTAAVLHKIATDIRLLCNRKELDEPFEDKQIGSSAMPYKRNPMRCERICGLTRFVMNLVGNAYDTAATQWLERTLDDSSNRRLSLPEAFLALDGALDLMHNVASGLIVHEAMVRKNLMAELPFMATENILMACVKAGGDRQHYHELIRVHAQAAGLRVKQEGLDNDLIDRLKADPAFHVPALKHELDWDGVLDPMKYIGRSVEQTERFIREVVEPLREQYGEAIAKLDQSAPRV